MATITLVNIFNLCTVFLVLSLLKLIHQFGVIVNGIIQHFCTSLADGANKKDTVLSRKEDAVAVHLSQNASNGPEVNGLGIDFRCEHNFRCSIPPGSHVLRQKTRLVTFRVCYAGQTEIAYLGGSQWNSNIFSKSAPNMFFPELRYHIVYHIIYI